MWNHPRISGIFKKHYQNIELVMNVNSNEIQMKDRVKYNQTLKKNKKDSQWQDSIAMNSNINLLAVATARDSPQTPG